MKYWKYHKVPFFVGGLFVSRMERKGWKVTKVRGVLLHTYRTSTYDRDLFIES